MASKGARDLKLQAGTHNPIRARGEEGLRACLPEKDRQGQEGERDGAERDTKKQERHADRGRDTEPAGALLRAGPAPMAEAGAPSLGGQLHVEAKEGHGLCLSW